MNLLGLHILLASLSCLSLAFPQNESALPDSYPSSAVDNSLHEKNEITHSSNSSDHYSSTIDLLEEEKKVNESTCISAAMKSPLCHRYVDERGHPLRSKFWKSTSVIYSAFSIHIPPLLGRIER